MSDFLPWKNTLRRPEAAHESWVAVAVIGSAVIGGVASYASAKEANKPRKGHTDQTSEPILFGSSIDDLNRILADQAALYEQGPPDYTKLLGGGGGKGVGARGNEAMDIYRQVAERGLGAGSTPGVQFGQGAIGDIWGTDTTGGPRPEGGLDPAMVQSAKRFGGDYEKALRFAQANPDSALGQNLAEREAAAAAYDARYPGASSGTGFEGYNPILAGVANELGGSSMDIPMDLLMEFLGENNRAGGGGPAAAGGSSSAAPGGGGESIWSGDVARAMAANRAGGGGGGVVPDTGAGSGLFQTEIQKMFDEGGHEQEIADLLESMGKDIERQGFRDMADLEARASGTGRFGGDWHSARITDAKRAQSEEIAKISAQLRYGDLDAQRQAKLRALEILNSRDVAAMSDATANRSISASAGSAAAGRDLQRELAAMENSRLLRGQDLSAIGALMQGEQFGLSGLMGLGDRLSSDRLNALSLGQGFENLGLSGLDRALGAAGGISGLESIDASARARGAANRREAALLNAQAPQRMINDYLSTVGAINAIGGGSHTYGTNVVPGAGVNAGAAAAQGALGAGLAAYGIAGGGGSARQNPNVTQSYDYYGQAF